MKTHGYKTTSFATFKDSSNEEKVPVYRRRFRLETAPPPLGSYAAPTDKLSVPSGQKVVGTLILVQTCFRPLAVLRENHHHLPTHTISLAIRVWMHENPTDQAKQFCTFRIVSSKRLLGI